VLECSGADDGVSEGYISVVTSDRQYITARRTSNCATRRAVLRNTRTAAAIKRFVRFRALHDVDRRSPRSGVAVWRVRRLPSISSENGADYCWISRSRRSISSLQTVASSTAATAFRFTGAKRWTITVLTNTSHLSGDRIIPTARCWWNRYRLLEILEVRIL